MSDKESYPKHPIRFVWLTFLVLSAFFAVCLLFQADLPPQAWPLAFAYFALVPACAAGIARLGRRIILLFFALGWIPVLPGIVGVALMFRSGSKFETGAVWLQISLYGFYAVGLFAILLSLRGWYLYWKQTKKDVRRISP
jgi:hypothetical protein